MYTLLVRNFQGQAQIQVQKQALLSYFSKSVVLILADLAIAFEIAVENKNSVPLIFSV